MEWELKIIDESNNNGFICYRVMDPMGYEQWMTQEEWDTYLTNRKKRSRGKLIWSIKEDMIHTVSVCHRNKTQDYQVV